MADGNASSATQVTRVEDEFDFRHPDYRPIYAARRARLSAIRRNPGMLEALKAHYKEHPVEFIMDWGMTVDPRNAEIGLDVVVPFVLFPKQREFIQWLYDLWRARDDGLVEKSRDMGASWLCVAFAAWMWLFHPGSVVGFGSRKEEYVDKIGDPKSLFWKVRNFVRLLPDEFKPKGYEERKHAPHMRIINPETQSAIVGEAGDNIGRGNRTSIYFKDESAFYEHAEAIEAALSQTSNCKIDISTPNTAGDAFARKRQSGKVPVFTFHWFSDPRKDDEWYETQKRKLEPSVVAREIDINYAAALTDAYIPGDAVAAAQRLGPGDIDIVGQWVIGVDAAHFGDDESVVHCRRGRLNLPQERRRGLNGIELASLVIGLAMELEQSSFAPVFAIVIELDGPGVSCYDQLRTTRFADRVHGVHTGARLADNVHYNLRARIWSDAKRYLCEGRDSLDGGGDAAASGAVVMPRCQDLASQLCAMTYKFNKDGLLLMQSKKEYKSINGRSPDCADAFVLTFAAPDVKAGPMSFEPGSSASMWQDESFEPGG